MRQVNVNEIIDESKFNSYHLLILILCAFTIICDGYDLVVYGTVVPALMKDWGISPLQAGTLASYALFGMMVGALFFGPLADKIGRKKVIIINLAMFGLFTMLVGTAQNPAQFGMYRFIAGLGLGGVMPNVIAMITEYSPKKLRSTLVTIMFSGMQVGAMIAAGAAIPVIPAYGWRMMFFLGGLPLLLIPFFILYLPESMNVYVAKNQTEKIHKWLSRLVPGHKLEGGEVYTIAEKKTSGMPVVSLFEEHRALSTSMFWVVMFMSLLMTYALQTWLPKLMQNAGYAMTSALWFMLILNIGAIVGAVVGGLLADRINGRKVIIVYFIIAFLAIIMLSFKNSTLMVGLLVFIVGATTMGTQIVCNAYVSQYYPNAVRSTGIGWSLGIGRIGGITGPLMVGFLLNLNLSLQANFIAIGVPAVIASVAMMIVQEKYNSANALAGSPLKQAV